MPPGGPPETHATAIGYMVSGAVFMLLGASMGFLSASYLVWPDLMANHELLHFGRSRPMHTNLVMFGFVVTMLLGACHFIIPQLSRTRLYSERMGLASLVLWDGSIAAGVIAIGMGYTQSREYAEMFFPADVGIALAVTLMIVNLFQTVRLRREPILYVTTWYFLGGLVLTLFTYFIGNCMWTGWPGAIRGVPDAVTAWFYGHNVLGLTMTPLAVGAAYYVLPRAAKNPVYSHALSLIGFWSLLVFYTHIGTHHLLQTPAPTWLKLISIVDSICMVIPVATVVINLGMSVQGRMALVSKEVGARFVWIGAVIIYMIVCVQGPFMSLPSVQRITHYTYWTPAHAHLAVLGFVGLTSWGTTYFIIPQITGRPLHSAALGTLHFWLMLLGVTAMMIELTIVGLVQGYSWAHGEVVYRTVPMLLTYNIARLITGGMVVASAGIGLYNLARSLQQPREATP
jgi:cbb3-type cytochrome c oxidase subunit I